MSELNINGKHTDARVFTDEAQERGFDGWVDAYHEMEVEE